MRKDCLLINSSRGGIVNEADLVEKEKRIAGAAMDNAQFQRVSITSSKGRYLLLKLLF